MHYFMVIVFPFLPISDIIGVCKEAMDVASITSKASGKELRKRDVQVVDDTNREVSFIF